MYDVQKLVENVESCSQGFAVNGAAIGRFYHFQVPTAELIGEEFESSHQCFVQTILAVEVVYFGICGVQFSLHPRDGHLVSVVVGVIVCNFPSFDEAEGVPHLVAESHTLSAKRIVIENVIASRSCKHHAHADTVGTIAGNEFKRVG